MGTATHKALNQAQILLLQKEGTQSTVSADLIFTGSWAHMKSCSSSDIDLGSLRAFKDSATHLKLSQKQISN